MTSGKIIFIDINSSVYESIPFYGDIAPDKCADFLINEFNKQPLSYDDFLELVNKFNAKYFGYANNKLTKISIDDHTLNFTDIDYIYILNMSKDKWTVKTDKKTSEIKNNSIEILYSSKNNLFFYNKPQLKTFSIKKIFIVVLVISVLAGFALGTYTGYRISKTKFDKQVQEIKAEKKQEKNPYPLGLVIQDSVTQQGRQINVLEVKSKAAKTAGFKVGDIILKFNDEPVSTGKELVEMLKSEEPNSIGHFLVSREGEELEIRMILHNN